MFQYQVIEYEYKTLTNKEKDYVRTVHQTNSRLLYYLIILCLKLSGSLYETIDNSK